MASDFIYIHLDSISNSVLLKGLNNQDFDYSVIQRPENILLLNPSDGVGEYEPHTALKVIRGENQVKEYFTLNKRKKINNIQWIDYKDINMVKQLTPMEIAELLYLGHMKAQLHSPFFYKLQNNFVFFEMPGDKTKIYYRHMEEFYKMLEDKIQKVVEEKLNEKKNFFKPVAVVKPMERGFLKELKLYLQEGIVFDFAKCKNEQQVYEIPLYIVEDRMKYLDRATLNEKSLVGKILYDKINEKWSIQMKDLDFLPFLKQA